jgi:hypothetical protein
MKYYSDLSPRSLIRDKHPGSAKLVGSKYLFLQLYEYCKKKKWQDPIFDCVAEDIQNEIRTPKGFVLRFVIATVTVPVYSRQEPKILAWLHGLLAQIFFGFPVPVIY